ncbi:MAG: hypothetical protein RW306_06770 [Geobacteraceae bacterium]|nr:hypothetical protein [Geobacteraceae bacterium]
MAKNASELHMLACYILHCMAVELAEQNSANNVQKNNRLIYEAIVFLCGDTLRTRAERDLGLQTKVVAPSKRIAGWQISYETVQCVLKQCQEQGWLHPPTGDNINYSLTLAGQEIIAPLLSDDDRVLRDDKSAALFTHSTQQIIKDLIKRLLILPKTKLDEEVRQRFKRAYQEQRLVAHYDLSDPGLKPFLTGMPVFQ